MRQVKTGPFVFLCQDDLEVWRAETLFTKEPATVEWLQQLQPGEVFYDVGANIGCYTLLAASRVGPTGHVYAFEPHLPTMAALIRNVVQNGLTDRVTVLPMPLSLEEGYCYFGSVSTHPGSSGHQLGAGGCFATICATASLDALLDSGVIIPAHLVKIDIDGQEANVIRGMSHWLLRDDHPRSLQMEMHPDYREVALHRLTACGYACMAEVDTSLGARARQAGQPERIISNAVFEPASALMGAV